VAADSPKKPKSKSSKEKKPQGKSQNERLKIVVRRLPPHLPEEVFWQSVSEWVSEETVFWKSFHAGKVKKRLNKESIPSRAYIAFKTEERLALFSRSFDGHIFRDKAGTETQAVVEFAPYQKIPAEKSKSDGRIATIEEDEDYLSFVKSLENNNPKPFDEETLGHLIASTQPAPEPKTTPLIEALIAEKAAQRDKEAILRNHAHYKDQSVINSAIPPSKREAKKKEVAKPTPPPESSKKVKKAAQKQAKGATPQTPKSAPANASTPVPTVMPKVNPPPKPVKEPRKQSQKQEPQKQPPRPKPDPQPSDPPTQGNTSAATSTPGPSHSGQQSAAPRRNRPVLGVSSRQFEVALSSAGVKSKKKEKEKKDDARIDSKATEGKTREEAAKEKDPPPVSARIDDPAPAPLPATSGPPPPSHGRGSGRSRGRGRGRGRGEHRGG